MVCFPNCKINLGLNIIDKRPDGYHNLETVFYPIAINDVLEIISSEINSDNQNISYTNSGLQIEGDQQNNLCIKAYHLLKKDFPDLPSITMHLHKNIPMGAGLGGGSADGAFALELLNKKYQLQISKQRLLQYALELGSDCPFFILNEPCLAKGRGEIMQQIALDLTAFNFFIVNPKIHISTAWAFSQITPSKPLNNIQEIICLPISEWRDKLINDFEAPVVQFYPEIGKIIEELYASGAIYAAMTGTGSTVFGIFSKSTQPRLKFPDHYYFSQVD